MTFEMSHNLLEAKPIIINDNCQFSQNFLVFRIIPESVRWLLSRGKLKRAEDVVIRIASYNSLRFDRTWLREEIAEVDRRLRMQTSDRAPGIRDVLGNNKIRKHSLVLFFIWFSVSLSYYGISYSIPNLSGDRYLNFMIGGGIELGAYLLAFVVLNGFGRKYPLMIYLLLSGGLCIGTVAVREYVPGGCSYSTKIMF